MSDPADNCARPDSGLLLAIDTSNGRVVDCNRAVTTATGRAADRVIGAPWSQLVHAEDRERVARAVRRIEAEGPGWLTCRLLHKDRSAVRYRIEATPGVDGATIFLWAHNTEAKVCQYEVCQYERLSDLAKDLFIVTDAQGTIIAVNDATVRAHGGTRQDYVGRPMATLLTAEGVDVLDDVQRRGAGGEHTIEFVMPAYGATGEVLLLEGTTTFDAQTQRWYTVERDIADRTRATGTHSAATVESLTHLPNRDAFGDALDAALASGHSVAVIMLDIDDFKRVNVDVGHRAGDALLTMVGERIAASLRRPDDMVARFGGDQFVVMLQGLRTASDAALVAEKIRLSLAEPFLVEGRRLDITASLGVAVGSRNTRTASQLVQEAHTAADQAKRSGRNRSQRFNTEMRATVDHQGRGEHELRHALDNDGIAIDVQGQFTTDGALTGVEALVRLISSDGERLRPAQFLDVARELDLLCRVGEAVFEKSFAALNPWLAANPHLTLSLNADMVELQAPGFFPTLVDRLARHRVDPSQLVIEVTEGGALDPGGAAATVLQSVQEMGAHVAIDDFGSGASSLAQLRDFQVDQVKIDRTLIHGMATNQVARSITEAVVGLGLDLGVVVVAEGVEHESDLALLRKLGCPLVQGFFLHRPSPVEAFLASDQARLESAHPSGMSV